MPAGKKVARTTFGPPPGIPTSDIEYRPIPLRPTYAPTHDEWSQPQESYEEEGESSFRGGLAYIWNGGVNVPTIAGVIMFLVAALLAVGHAAPVVVIVAIVVGVALIFRGRGEARDEAEDDEILMSYIPAMGQMSPALAREVAYYSQRGYRVVSQTPAGVHMIRPKRFSFFWAFLWFLVLVFGLIVYLLYYASKRDESIYLRIGRDGKIVARRGRS